MHLQIGHLNENGKFHGYFLVFVKYIQLDFVIKVKAKK